MGAGEVQGAGFICSLRTCAWLAGRSGSGPPAARQPPWEFCIDLPSALQNSPLAWWPAPSEDEPASHPHPSGTDWPVSMGPTESQGANSPWRPNFCLLTSSVQIGTEACWWGSAGLEKALAANVWAAWLWGESCSPALHRTPSPGPSPRKDEKPCRLASFHAPQNAATSVAGSNSQHNGSRACLCALLFFSCKLSQEAEGLMAEWVRATAFPLWKPAARLFRSLWPGARVQ